MIPSRPQAPGPQHPSVAEAKRSLLVWGEDANTQAATMRSQVGTSLQSLAIGSAVAAVIFVTIRRILPTRTKVPSRAGPLATNSRDMPAPKVGLGQQVKPVARRLIWLAIGRASRWILPHAIGAVQSTLAGAATAKPGRSAPNGIK
jgi:hypothetical protein